MSNQRYNPAELPDEPSAGNTPAPDAWDQKAFLAKAKSALAKVHKGLTWDRMAQLADIEPRALKTYRMPENSPDRRAMPKSVRRQIEALLQRARRGEAAPVDQSQPPQRSGAFRLIGPALAALVVRTAAHVHAEGVIVSGLDRIPGARLGLTPEDRRTMALVSRARLSLGLPDVTAEIHNLLALCTQPLRDWLAIPEILDEGLGPVRLIDPEQLLPTVDSEGLAHDVAGLTSLFEEQIFGDFREALAKFPTAQAEAAYTTVREFAVRNPVVHASRLNALLEDVPSAIANRVRAGFYEALPLHDDDTTVRLCGHCRNLMKRNAGGWLCTTSACVQQCASLALDAQPAAELFRLNRGLRQFWLEPGIDEIRLHDALKAAGLSPRLYPHRDRVDIELGAGSGVGIDLKAYASPELLGRRISRDPGGLASYAQRWLVIPDWLAEGTPQYMNRLAMALRSNGVQCMTVSEALKRATAMRVTNA